MAGSSPTERAPSVVYALEPCRHPSSEGYREGITYHGDGTWTLKDGCRVRALVPPPRCPVCETRGAVLPGKREDWTDDEWRSEGLLDLYGVQCPGEGCKDGWLGEFTNPVVVV